MDGRLRVGVLKRQDFIILEDNPGGYASLDDSAENARVHGLIQPHNECLRRQVRLAEALCQKERSVLRAFVTDADAIKEAVAAIKVLNDDRPELRFDALLQPLSVAAVLKGSYLYRENSRDRAARPKSQNLQAYPCNGWHVYGLGCRIGEVDNAPLDERPAVVNSHRHFVAVLEVVNIYPSSKRQGAVSGGHVVHVVDFAAGGWTPVVGMAVPGSDSFFALDNRGGCCRGPPHCRWRAAPCLNGTMPVQAAGRNQNDTSHGNDPHRHPQIGSVRFPSQATGHLFQALPSPGSSPTRPGGGTPCGAAWPFPGELQASASCRESLPVLPLHDPPH